MSTVSFIIPTWHYYADPFKHQPYWELYYATQIKKKGFDVNIIDLRMEKKDSFVETINNIPQRDFYFYWIFKTGDAKELYSVVKLLKKKYPESIHAAGGTHVDMCQTECKRHFDCIVVGPGENSFVNVINDAREKSLSDLYSENYNSVPFANTYFPDRSFLPKKFIVTNKLFDQYDEIKGTLTYFSRGCMFKCAFCTYNLPSYLQIKSPEMIRKEIAYLKDEYEIEGILVKDEVAISPNKKISTQVLNAIGESEIVWRGQTTTKAAYEQLVMAKESGCLELAVGVETVDDGVMKIINKTWQTEKNIKEYIENSKSLDIKVKICLILGLPGEPRNILDKTIRFLEETEPDYASVSGFLPVPGSPIYKDYKKYGIKYIDKDWDKYSHLLFRFSDEEEVGLPFEYDQNTTWGKSFTRDEIKLNIIEIQRWLEARGMIY